MSDKLGRVRLLIAALAGFTSIVPFIVETVGDPVVLIPISMPIIASVAIFFPRLGPQLLARAAWWSNFILGVLLCLTSSERRWVPYLVLGSGVALLLAGRVRVAQALEQSRYSPAAFQATLLALMVLALADASMLVFIGVLAARLVATTVLVAAGAGLVVGFVGLLRIRIWGVYLNVAISGATAAAVALRILKLNQDFALSIEVLGAFHVLVAAPMLVSLAFKKPLPSIPQRVGARIAAGLIVIVMLVTMAAELGVHHMWFWNGV